MIRKRPSLRTAALLAAALALGVAACGSDSSSSDSSTTAASTTSGSDTVAVRSVSGAGDVLVDAQGQVLYTNDMDTASKIACSAECAAIWVPLTLPAGTSTPVGQADLGGKLGVVTNPAGDQQVTFDGKPLYTFVQDSPGQATGDGVTDSFGGTSFTWTAATAGNSSSGTSSNGSSGSTSSGGSSSGGGYGY